MRSETTVLVVDDDRDCSRAIRQLLEDDDCGLTVITAGSGAEALSILSTQKVDCLLTDYRMPGMTGLELLVQVKQTKPHIARLLMTAYPDFELAMRAINEIGVKGYFPKPVEPEGLCRHLQDAVAA